MKITKILERDMGHRVPNHESKCRNLHGHRYKAEITLEGDVIGEKGVSSEGMVIDFSHIKRIAGGFIDEVLDHGYMCQEGDVVGDVVEAQGWKLQRVPFVPTAENIVAWLFDKLQPTFEDTYGTKLQLASIRLYETPTSYVDYPTA